jgi:hypothetical protein
MDLGFYTNNGSYDVLPIINCIVNIFHKEIKHCLDEGIKLYMYI